MESPVRRKPGRPAIANGVPTREGILRAARDVFTDIGYSASTFRTIAARAGLTRPAIHHYFANKAQLYLAAIGQPAVTVIDMAAASGHQARTLPARLVGFLRAALGTDTGDLRTAQLVITALREPIHNPSLVTDEGGVPQAVGAFFSSAVHDAIECGEVSATSDARTIAETMIALLYGVGTYAISVGAKKDLTTIVERLELLLTDKLWQTP